MEHMIYTITAYRWGETDNHSYVVGVFSTLEKATICADAHTEYRGGKYACVVDELRLDTFDNDDLNYSKEVYRTTSLKN
jgi:hypothetical protein